MKRIFITGGSGMLGSYTAIQAAESGWETWANYSSHPVQLTGCEMLKLDIRAAAEVSKAFDEIRPDVVIHTSALVKPDICEQRKTDAFAVNALGTHNVIVALEKAGAHLVHVSTDLVFDGESNPFRVDDTPSPVNYYGLTKVAAEAEVYASSLSWSIVRPSVIYGPRKFPFLESFSDRVIESLRAGQRIGAFADQYRCPIPAWNLADVLLEIGERRLTGIFHAVCPEVTTRYQFARKIAEVFGLDDSLLTPVSMDDVKAVARRPKVLVLDTFSTSRTLETPLLGFEDGIRELLSRQG